MYKKDFIQRQFEEFGKVLAELLLLRKSGDWQRFEKELEEAATKFSSSEIGMVGKMSREEFSEQVLLPEHITLQQKKMLARLMFEQLEAKLAVDIDCGDLAYKCLDIYTFLQQNLTSNEFDLDVHYKLALLKKITA